MSKAVHYALIGCTGIGGYHLEAIRALARDGSVKLAAVTDPALGSLPELRAELVQGGTRVYLDYRDMLSDKLHLEVVVIAVPIPLHLEITHACLARNVFVYLEKPPVPLIQQWESLRAADKDERIGVGFQMILGNRLQKMKQAIMHGHLGRLQSIRIGACWPRLDGYYSRNSSAGKMAVRGEPVFDGPATNALAHLIHNAMFIAGEGQGGFAAPQEIRAELYRARPIESYDIACLQGSFPSGVSFSAALTHATADSLPYRMEISGSKGWARISKDGATFESSFPCATEREESFEDLLSKTHRQFFAFVQGAEPRPSTSLMDTRGYLLTTNGMLLSSAQIHPIDDVYVQRYQREDSGGYDVQGLRAAVETSCQTGKLFSELGLPWAVETKPVSVENLKSLTFPTDSIRTSLAA